MCSCYARTIVGMVRKIDKTLLYCLVFLICSIIGYLIYPFYNLLSIYLVSVLIVYLCSIFSNDNTKFHKYALILLILFFVGHIMGLGAALVWSIYVLMEYDFSYLRSSHGHEYPLMMFIATCTIFCLTSIYICYLNVSKANLHVKEKKKKGGRPKDYGSVIDSNEGSGLTKNKMSNDMINMIDHRESVFNSDASLLSSKYQTTTV